jgi:hypothetical protein
MLRIGSKNCDVYLDKVSCMNEEPPVAKPESISATSYFEMSPEKAKQVFKEIIETASELQTSGKQQELYGYILEMYERYFSFSPGPFNYLSLQDHFEILIQVNKIDELRGAIGQNGVGELVYRLAGFQYETEDAGENKIQDFVRSALKDKDVSTQIQILVQLQTIGADSLTVHWAEPVYNAIQKFLKETNPSDNFIIATLKKRLFNRLTEEMNTPTMGVVTTLQNTHQAIMFENLLAETELLFSKKLLEKVSFLGKTPVTYTLQISSDHYGLYDSRSQLVGVINKKLVDEQTLSKEKPPEIPFTDIHDKTYLSGFGLNENLVEVLKVLEDPYFRNQIENLFGINLKETDLRMQTSILKFLATRPVDEVTMTAQEIQLFEDPVSRLNAFKVLLAHENFEFIEGIMYWYNQLQEIAIPLYKKYAEMTSGLDEVTSFLTDNFRNEYEKDVVLKIREGLIQKASEVLLKYSDQIHSLLTMEELVGGMDAARLDIASENSHYTEMRSNVSRLRESILADIEKINKDTLLLLSAFRSLIKGNPAVSIEDIKNSRMQSYSPEEMRGDSMRQTVEKMRSIYSSNVTNTSIREALLAKFDARIADPENTSEFDILYFKDELLAFIIFTKEPRGGYYASGLNVSPNMQGSGIGEVMMRETIVQKTKTADVHGEVIATKDVVRRYLRDGAVMFGAETKHGEVGMKIVWSKDNTQYKTKDIKSKTDDEIYQEVKALEENENIQVIDVEDQSKINFDLTNKGYAITHILKLSDGKISAVFEKSTLEVTV